MNGSKSRTFVWMFLTAILCNIIFQMVRSSKDTLVVTAAGAEIIPYLFFWVVLPASLLLTWFLARAMQRFSLRTLFPLTAALFVGYLLLFSFLLFPSAPSTLPNLPMGLGLMIGHWSSVLYYCTAELWKVALLTILFWATLNRYTPIDRAKKLYPPIMISTSIGALIAGRITIAASSEWIHNHLPLAADLWPHNLRLQTVTILLLAVAMCLCYRQMLRHMVPKEQVEEEPAPKLSLKNVLRSKLVMLLATIQFADYLAYSLGHLVFLDTVKSAYPDPNLYSNFMGSITFWTGIINGACALVITPYLWKRCSWTTMAMITPIVLILTAGTFFVLRMIDAPISLTLFAGASYYILCRAAKYTMLDSAKEIALIPLDKNLQLEGKLAMDGIFARGGRVTASLMQVGLFSVYGGIAGAFPAISALAFLFAFIWIGATAAIPTRTKEVATAV